MVLGTPWISVLLPVVADAYEQDLAEGMIMPEKCIFRWDHRFHCDLSATDDGWATIVSGMEPVDDEFVCTLDTPREWEWFKYLLQGGGVKQCRHGRS